MKEIQNLLSQVSIIVKKNAEFLDATGGRFNTFRLIGVNHYENVHSAILAEFLNPHGSHGLKSKLLKAFFAQLILPESFKDFDFENSHVKTEARTEEGRIDILIHDNRSHAVIIENKIFASDQHEQLKRYNQFANLKYGEFNYCIFYLTLKGSSASDNSARGIDYVKISYASDIITWLENCVLLASRFPIVRETLNQYITHLKQLTNQDMDTLNQDELIEILCRPENIESAIKISENIIPAKFKIVEKMAKYVAEQCSVEYEVNKLADGITFFKNYWKKSAGIFFASDNNKTYYSIKTVEARTGNAIPLKRIDILFEKKEDCFNPYGYGYVMSDHWQTNSQLLIKMSDHTLSDNIIIPYLKKVLLYLNDHPEIDEIL